MSSNTSALIFQRTCQSVKQKYFCEKKIHKENLKKMTLFFVFSCHICKGGDVLT